MSSVVFDATLMDQKNKIGFIADVEVKSPVILEMNSSRYNFNPNTSKQRGVPLTQIAKGKASISGPDTGANRNPTLNELLSMPLSVNNSVFSSIQQSTA